MYSSEELFSKKWSIPFLFKKISGEMVDEWFDNDKQITFITQSNVFGKEERKVYTGIIIAFNHDGNNEVPQIKIKELSGDLQTIIVKEVIAYFDPQIFKDIVENSFFRKPLLSGSPSLDTLQRCYESQMIITIREGHSKSEWIETVGFITDIKTDYLLDEIIIFLNYSNRGILAKNIIAHSHPFSLTPTFKEVQTLYKSKKNIILIASHPLNLRKIILEGTITKITKLGSNCIINIGNYKLPIRLHDIISFSISKTTINSDERVNSKLLANEPILLKFLGVKRVITGNESSSLIAGEKSSPIETQKLMQSGFFRSLFFVDNLKKDFSKTPAKESPKDPSKDSRLRIDLRVIFTEPEIEFLIKYLLDGPEKIESFSKEIVSLKEALLLFILADYFICSEKIIEKAQELIFEYLLQDLVALNVKDFNGDKFIQWTHEKERKHPIVKRVIASVMDWIEKYPYDFFLKTPQDFLDCITYGNNLSIRASIKELDEEDKILPPQKFLQVESNNENHTESKGII